jgi:hypothetical protein
MNRRIFIERSMVLAAALTLQFKNTFAGTAQNVVKGKVTAKGKPVPNVQVTDGFSIVSTGKDGSYRLTPHERAEFVYISIPSGFDFPHEKQIAGHYRKLDKDGNLDFLLTPLSKSDSKHSFILWADPQVKNKKDVDQMLQQSVPDTLQSIKDLGPDALVHGLAVGDLVWDNHDLFPMYNEAVAEMGIPFFQGLGNHDMDYRLGDDSTSDQTFKKHYGPTYYSFNRGRAHYVMLDDVRYLGTERDYDGFISEQQLSWLEKDLAFVKKDDLLIVSLHIPVYSHVKNNQDLYKILKPFQNVHILSGHTHFNENNQTDNVYEHNHGAVCGAWWTGPVCEDGTPRGYGVYTVEGTELKWQYKGIDLEKSKQMSLFVDSVGGSKKLTANVWNWDPKWKVEYWLDGAYKGLLKNERGLDPLTVELYTGAQLPNPRPFVEPKETGHLFTAEFPTEVKQVRVLATDRFGAKFEEQITA